MPTTHALAVRVVMTSGSNSLFQLDDEEVLSLLGFTFSRFASLPASMSI